MFRFLQMGYLSLSEIVGPRYVMAQMNIANGYNEPASFAVGIGADAASPLG